MTETGMIETGKPSPGEDDAPVTGGRSTTTLKDAGNTAERDIERDSAASEAIDRATAAVGKDEG